MTPEVLFIVTSSPKLGGRVSEALRIAAGVGAWKKIEASIYLRGDATAVLRPDVDIFDEDNVERYLELIGSFQRPIFVDCDSVVDPENIRGKVMVRKVSDVELARVASACKYLMRF